MGIEGERTAGFRTGLALLAVMGAANACNWRVSEMEMSPQSYQPSSEENLKNKPIPLTMRAVWASDKNKEVIVRSPHIRERISELKIEMLRESGKQFESSTERGRTERFDKGLLEVVDDVEVGVTNSKIAWPTWGPIYGFFGGGHEGLDISPPLGTPIVAAENGIVVGKFDWTWSAGRHVLIYHGQGFTTLYAHLSEFNAELGDRVQRGEMIGRVGATGKVTGPHLHFEVRYLGKAMNPLDYLQR